MPNRFFFRFFLMKNAENVQQKGVCQPIVEQDSIYSLIKEVPRKCYGNLDKELPLD